MKPILHYSMWALLLVISQGKLIINWNVWQKWCCTFSLYSWVWINSESFILNCCPLRQPKLSSELHSSSWLSMRDAQDILSEFHSMPTCPQDEMQMAPPSPPTLWVMLSRLVSMASLGCEQVGNLCAMLPARRDFMMLSPWPVVEIAWAKTDAVSYSRPSLKLIISKQVLQTFNILLETKQPEFIAGFL